MSKDKPVHILTAMMPNLDASRIGNICADAAERPGIVATQLIAGSS